MTLLKGRAATPIRPGIMIKQVLTGQTPLHTGETVSESAIVDLHSTYKELIRRENTLRPKVKRLRGMTYPSFLKIFKFAQLLHLVELVREEPMSFPPPRGNLYSLRKPDGVHVVTSTRRVFKITAVGAEDEKSWTNLCKAWIEGWAAPQAIVYVVPPIVEKPPVVKVPPKVKPPKKFKWVEVPTKRQFGLLMAHLESLAAIGIADPAVAAEVHVLSMKPGDWLIWIDDALEDARAVGNVAEIKKLEGWTSGITSMMEFLEEDNFEGAIASLREIV